MTRRKPCEAGQIAVGLRPAVDLLYDTVIRRAALLVEHLAHPVAGQTFEDVGHHRAAYIRPRAFVAEDIAQRRYIVHYASAVVETAVRPGSEYGRYAAAIAVQRPRRTRHIALDLDMRPGEPRAQCTRRALGSVEYAACTVKVYRLDTCGVET